MLIAFGFTFLAGFFTSWVFGMVTRMLPATWARYGVRFGDLRRQPGLGTNEHWWLDVFLNPPVWWRRALMDPLTEYLSARVQLDSSTTIWTMWEQGDIGSLRLRADGVLGIRISVCDVDRGNVYWPE